VELDDETWAELVDLAGELGVGNIPATA